jgi:hypothetical protein
MMLDPLYMHPKNVAIKVFDGWFELVPFLKLALGRK